MKKMLGVAFSSNFDEVDGVGVVQQVISDILLHGGSLLLLLPLPSSSPLSPFLFCIVKENGEG
jgi:hypothetical protein